MNFFTVKDVKNLLKKGKEIKEEDAQWVNKLPVPMGTVIIVCLDEYHLSLAYTKQELQTLILTCEGAKIYSIPMESFEGVEIIKM